MQRYRLVIILAIIIVTPLFSFATEKAVQADLGMVVCVSPPAADVGVEILKQGGNAVDAAVAVAFVMAVTYPAAGNIGGGGFMLVFPGKDRDPVIIDYRETAPASIKEDTLAKDKNWYSHRAVGVPGTVRGLEAAHAKFGKLPWKTIVMPAVKLAEDGFSIREPLALSLNQILTETKEFKEFQRVFGNPDGREWKAGDRLVQKDLGRTLRKIAEEGGSAFYSAGLGDLLVREIKVGGGFITQEDLRGYQAKIRPAIHGTYRGYDVYGAPPPSSGGVCLIEMLNMVEKVDLKKQERWSPATLHLLIETSRRAYCDRARYLGDPDFTTIPEHLTSKEYAKKLASAIDRNKATPSVTLAEGITLTQEGENTTHFSIIDRDGMAVSNTYTLEDNYGSRVVVRGAGYLLNNEMGDFNTRPGVTTKTGIIGTKPNRIAPGKRMLSSQSPTILAKNGKAVLVTGSPGGRTIINTVFNVVVNVVDFEMDVQAAVDAPRYHHQWLPDVTKLESPERFPKLIEELKVMGHSIAVPKQPYIQGDAHSIWIDPKTGLHHGAADKRIDGKAAGLSKPPE